MDWLQKLKQLGVRAQTAADWAPMFAEIVVPEHFSKGADEIDDFTAQILHESAMLERLEESLNYSAQGLMKTWPSRFPTLADATPYARKPEAIANKVYGGRMGNCSDGDGWAFRGSGLIQVTGRDNTKALCAAIKWADTPEALAKAMRTDKGMALKTAIVWWEGHVPDAFMNDDRKVRRAVNGGAIGLEDTIRLRKLFNK